MNQTRKVFQTSILLLALSLNSFATSEPKKPISEENRLEITNQTHASKPFSLTKNDIAIGKKTLLNVLKNVVNKSNPEAKKPGVLGWVLLGLGFAIFLFASILIGGLIMLVGLIIVLVQLGQQPAKTDPNLKTTTEKPAETALEDVVYLKNGTVIRGKIMEQTPNVSIKIQTADGNIFVYKMEEITKISREAR